ncbi:MmcQ/YjbR family DNA-binding protein [Agarivorans sp. 1_MG-2023]|uniref:MmcQ/YjbR family DNA-binding protein n=1 Tax=Agarivorans sp. 1_MG-2023 TaxID=3062634 RepID=UPI0026E1E961|nr:MmcQ/YjbR family DNA-binding protein [Agarivorans sp. 1_MG-2023]MDO6762957.1 MmcQ/YjbR family DNA-binding protein [Agarivorans sp. 1_MG-2023]
MDHQQFNQFCRALVATTYVVQWGGAHVWKVGGKVFAIGFTLKGDKPAFTFKTSDLNFDYLSESEGHRPAPYFASRGMKWIQQTDTSSELDEELEYYLSESYRIVASGLTKKKRAELGIEKK